MAFASLEIAIPDFIQQLKAEKTSQGQIQEETLLHGMRRLIEAFIKVQFKRIRRYTYESLF